MFCNLGQLVLHEKEVRTTHWFSGWTLFLEELVLLHITAEPRPTCTDTSNNKLNIQSVMWMDGAQCAAVTLRLLSAYIISIICSHIQY